MGWLKHKLPRKRWKRALIYAGSVLLLLLSFDMLLTQWWRRIEVSPETTRIVSPLNDRGMPDYVAALNALASEGVTAENNASPALLRIMGTDNFPPGWREKVLPQLGLPGGPAPAMFQLFDAWSKTHPEATTGAVKTDEDEDPSKKWWTPADHSRWGQWLKEQGGAVAAAREAVNRPRFYVPYSAAESKLLTDVQLPYLASLRGLSMLLAADAMRCAGERDAAGFRADVAASLKLGRLLAERPVMIEYLVALAIERQGVKAISRAAGTEGFLSAQGAKELLAFLDSLAPLPPGSRTIDMAERWMFLDSVGAMAATGQRPGEAPTVGHRMTTLFLPVHYNELLREGNEHYDRLTAAWRQPTYRGRQAAQKVMDAEVTGWASEPVSSKLMHPSRAVTRAFVAVLIPAVDRVNVYEERARMELDLGRIALALRVYRGAHAGFPEGLSVLTPDILKMIPPDGFADQPVVYRREGKGYVLYSVGPNEKDDGGLEQTAKSGADYDLVVRGQ